jgi:hypothetical protein
MNLPYNKTTPTVRRGSSGRWVIATGILCAVVPTVPVMWLGQEPVAATTTLGPLKSVACKPMASDPAIEAPLYAQQNGASGKSDGWWCQLPHATRVPAGLVPLRRDSAPLPNNYDLDETVYTAAGKEKDAAVNTRSPAIIVEVKVNSAVAPGATARVPQFSSAHKVVLKKGVTAYVLTESGQTDVSWGFTTGGSIPKYLSAVSSITVAGFDVPASMVIAVAKHVAPL